MSKTVPQIKTDRLKFDAQTIRVCQRYVHSVQRKLDRAVAEGNRKKIRLFTWLLSKRSRAVRILAVYRATIENEGKNTAGVDGMKVLEGKTEKEKKHNSELREWLITNADIKKKPSPIRRTYIKKSNGKLRPLGIPTLLDRVIQDVLTEILDIIQNRLQSLAITGFKVLQVILQFYQTQSPCGSILEIASETAVFLGYIQNTPRCLYRQIQCLCGISILIFDSECSFQSMSRESIQ